ncbi:MAG: encapsulin-associated ferritin-like protein [Myxococcota bacterium]
MSTPHLHEPRDELSTETVDLHRALVSLIEELEAVDWYAQRVDATRDDELASVLAHSRDEEKEHACMTLEWIRRRDPGFDRLLRRFLFRDGAIVGGEAAHDAAPDDTLRIGSLRGAPTDPPAMEEAS